MTSKILAITLTLSLCVALDARAICPKKTVILYPGADNISRGSFLVIKLFGHDKADLDEQRIIKKMHLTSVKDRRKIGLRIIATHLGAARTKQVVVRPRLALKPRIKYTLKIPGGVDQLVRMSTRRAPKATPKWIGEPGNIKKKGAAPSKPAPRLIRPSRGPSDGTMLKTGLPRGAWAILKHVGTKHSLLVQVNEDDQVRVGTNHCSTDFVIGAGGKYTFELVPVSATYSLGKPRRFTFVAQ